MKQLLIFSGLVLLLAACGKDKFQTKPHLKIRSVNPQEVALGQPVVITMEFTDKEGDVTDSLFFVRERLNSNGPFYAMQSYKIPAFPKTQKGDIVVNLDYFRDLTLQMPEIRIPGSNPSRNEIDTMRLKFVARDKAGNSSDTAIVNDLFVEQ